MTIITTWLTVQTIQASIDYWLEKSPTFMKGTFPNSITIYCKNGGGIDGDFILGINFVNASFSNETSKPYLQVDDSTAKFRFLLHKGESNQKLVYFSIHENVKGFLIQIWLEKINFYDVLKPNGMYPTSLKYQWDEQAKIFRLIE